VRRRPFCKWDVCFELASYLRFVVETQLAGSGLSPFAWLLAMAIIGDPKATLEGRSPAFHGLDRSGSEGR
jgi:hypothetical protein